MKIHGTFLCIFVKFTNTPGNYRLLVYRIGGTLPTSPAPMTLTIGNSSGSTLMDAKLAENVRRRLFGEE